MVDKKNIPKNVGYVGVSVSAMFYKSKKVNLKETIRKIKC